MSGCQWSCCGGSGPLSREVICPACPWRDDDHVCDHVRVLRGHAAALTDGHGQRPYMPLDLQVPQALPPVPFSGPQTLQSLAPAFRLARRLHIRNQRARKGVAVCWLYPSANLWPVIQAEPQPGYSASHRVIGDDPGRARTADMGGSNGLFLLSRLGCVRTCACPEPPDCSCETFVPRHDWLPAKQFAFAGGVRPVGLDYWIWLGQPAGLGSSLSDLFDRLPARSSSTRLSGDTGPA